jgi:nucleoid-associated protein YgaU
MGRQMRREVGGCGVAGLEGGLVMRSLIRATVRTVVTLWWAGLLLVGVPFVLTEVIGWRPPTRLPSGAQWQAQWQEWGRQPPTAGFLVAVVAWLAWLMWAVLVVAVLADVYHLLRRVCRRLPRLRLPGPVQGLSAALLGTVTVTSTAGAAAVAAPATTHVAAVDEHPHPGIPAAVPHTSASSTTAAAATTGPPMGRDPDTPTSTMVAATTGHRASNTTGARPTVTGPASTGPLRGRPSRAATMAPTRVVVVPGRASTPGRATASTIHNGPLAGHAAGSVSGTLTVVAGGTRYTYTVRTGDNLSHIAAAWLGDPDRWPEIYHLNEGRHFPTVGGTLADPDLIYPGWTLVLPDDAHPPGQAADPGPAARNPTPPSATPSPPVLGPAGASAPTPGATALQVKC